MLYLERIDVEVFFLGEKKAVLNTIPSSIRNIWFMTINVVLICLFLSKFWTNSIF